MKVVKEFVPSDFLVPQKLETEKFRLRMLTIDDVEKDYEAVMSSKEELRNPLDKAGWPRDNMTIEENLSDLREHQEEFSKREAFTYTVVNLDESKCLGCVYIYPSEKGSFDAEIYLWARSSELKNGLDELLYKTVKKWIKEQWHFNNVAYPGREIGWNEWVSM
jgi:hypothetical protein